MLPFDYAVRNLIRSPVRLAAGVLGSALVVLLVLAAGGFVRGMERSLSVSGSGRNVILLGAGSEESVERSQIDMTVPTLVGAGVLGVKRRLGVEYVSPEVHAAIVLKTSAESGEELQAVVRGFTPTAFLVHSQVRITRGTSPRPGEYELMVGRLTATRLGVEDAELAVGRQLWFDNHAWTITGRFAAPQTVMDAEVWVPLTDLRIATRRDTLSCVVLTLGEATFEDVSIWCAQRLDLELVATRQSDYYASLLTFYQPIRAMVWVTAALIALGGLFGGVNTMYAAFAARVRELGALRTLGFPRRALVVTFLQESLLVSSAGGIIAAMVGLCALDGVAVRFSMGAFALLLDVPVLAGGLAAGAGLAIVGVIPPLWRCLRLPIVDALRTS
ncbi:MAG: ABC transporter permease [bacterium]|nr:ABC transporter permease [bacterium]